MLSLLQVYRGFASLLVVLYHSSGIIAGYWGESAFLHAFDFGRAGVQFFFVLSGFIIYYVHHKDIGTGMVLPYLQKRIVRVYPVYIFVTLMLAPFWLFVPSFGEPYHKSVSALILSLFLIPQDHYPHLGVAWTLIHEMMFYLAFAALIVSRAAGRIVLGLWFVAILGTNVLLSWDLPFPASYVMSVNNLLFAMGMLAAYLVLHVRLRRLPGAFLFGNLLFLAAGALWNRYSGMSEAVRAMMILLFGLASFIIVVHATQPDLEQRFKRQKALLLIGDASYSIYLAHYPALSVVCKLFARLGIVLPTIVTFIMLAIVGTAAGIVLHLLVEKPLLAWCRARLVSPGWVHSRAQAE